MKRLSRFVGIFTCAATVAIAGCAANGGVTTTPGSSTVAQVPKAQVPMAQVPIGARYMPTLPGARPASQNGIQYSYWNGPVLVNPKVYLIFWDYKHHDPDGVAKLLVDYITAMGGSGHNNIYTQYYDTVSGKTNYITNRKHQLGGVWFDNSAIPQNPTDAQIAAEAVKGVAKLGYDADGSYVVATASGHSSQGFGTQWCAYHSDTYSAGNLVSYTNLPYMPDAGKNCGGASIKPPKDESRKDEGVTIVEGGMEGDSVTDPNPGSGWYNFEYGEIGCGSMGLANEKFGDKSYTVGEMYSNASESCVQTYQ